MAEKMANPENEPPRPGGWTRRTLIRRVLWGAGGGAGGLLAWAAGWEPFRPVLERVDVPLPNLPPALDGLRIAHLSDLHIQRGFPARRLRPVVGRVNALRPDLIALTGDYVYDGETKFEREARMRACADALAPLRARLGVFATFGNHDFPVPPADPPRGPWEAAGITPLLDESVTLTPGGVPLHIVGLRSALVRPTWPGFASPAGEMRLLLWHEPDRAEEAARAGADLMLSGHTHGGQVRLPLAGALVLPPMGRRYPAGLYKVGEMSLYVTRGIGMLPPLVRLNCPPEITLLTLRRRAG